MAIGLLLLRSRCQRLGPALSLDVVPTRSHDDQLWMNLTGMSVKPLMGPAVTPFLATGLVLVVWGSPARRETEPRTR